MDLDWLRHHVQALKAHLDHFQLMQHQLEMMYERSLQLHTDLAIRSALVEQYSRHIDRQQKVLARMSELHRQAFAQLSRLEAQQA